MTRRSRRTVLYGTASLVALSAGCLDEMNSGSDDDTGTDDDPGSGSESGGGNGNDGDTDDGDTDDSDDSDDSSENGEPLESVSFAHSDPPSEPTATILDTTDELDDWLEDHQLEDGDVADLVDGIDFDTSVLTAIEALGPNLCYTMTLEEKSIDEDESELVLEATVESEEEDDVACAQQIVSVGHLVRASLDGEPIASASVTITDADGDEHDLDPEY
ncbi:hypothetical protein [Natronorubrum daqingense]|uniref:Uncharacterized protein n=1 Tax=Natronorubrum daqingense TaxID=588898 RepID=A0A1N6XMS5_9EURY|nr:hypothetical protein [Natronorubrum daqingense]APX95908.1 hypothetical protein BB347_04355 [Natronorubrum daqingense]SIR03664.1 hypothetical protein SAMN05421809_0163 [Natronorubrum daqingense]